MRWQIGMADKAPFAVAGMWRSWEEADGSTSHSFTHLTINADAHPLLKRFHKPDNAKRTLVVVPPDAYRDWLSCRDPEFARAFLNPCPHELLQAWEWRESGDRTWRAEEGATGACATRHFSRSGSIGTGLRCPSILYETLLKK